MSVKYPAVILIAFLLVVVTACMPPVETISTTAALPTTDTTRQEANSDGTPNLDANEISSTPVVELIKGKEIKVDQVVHGLLCDAHWKGTVYVDKDVQVKPWQGKPDFLSTCDFTVEDGTAVYVAAHNDNKYLKGCTCHQ
jgi:hypothetical protein